MKKGPLQNLADHLPTLAIATLTLGLAPFTPQPHLWQKITWLAQGGQGMVWYDYFDLLLHGSPWVLLLLGFIGKLTAAAAPNTPARKNS